MKIFFDCSIFHVQERGGISRYILSLATELSKIPSVSVLVYGGWTKNKVLTEFKENPSLRIIYLSRPSKLRINSFAEKLSYFWQKLEYRRFQRGDEHLVYHSTYFRPDYTLVERADLKVQTFYDMIPEIYSDGSKHSSAHLSERKKIVETADLCLSISKSTARDLAKYYPEYEGRIEVTHLASKITNVTEKRDIPEVPYFLYVGNRGGYKNGDLVIEAFIKIAELEENVCLVLFGGEELSEAELMRIRSFKLEDRIIRISGSDGLLCSAYQHSLALIYPSSYEGFGLPILESMECGCPVITAKNSSLPEVAGDAAIYSEISVDGILKSMQKVIRFHRNERKAITDKGFRQAKMFSWENTAKKTYDAYKAIIGF